MLFLTLQTVRAQDSVVTYLFDNSLQHKDYNINIHHINAYIEIKPETRFISGKAEFLFDVFYDKTDSVSFILECEKNPRKDEYEDNTPWKIKEVRVNDKKCNFKISEKLLTIRTEFPLSDKILHKIEIVYTVYPVPPVGIYFTGWDSPNPQKPKQVWAHRPFGWLPYYNARLTMNLKINFNASYKVFANGKRESVTDNSDGTKTWCYVMNKEHPFFSTCLVAGDYEYKNIIANDGTPVELIYYPGGEERIEPTYRYTEYMFEFFENEFGFHYPYPLYREIPLSDYLYGGMETTTSTVYGDFMLIDSAGFLGRNFVNVNSHELSHQWFGDYITHLRARDVWLTESFATYFAKKFEKDIFGEDYYENERNNELIRTFSASQKDNYPVGHSKGNSDRWYPKGSLILDMMRDYLGDDGFKKSIKHYIKRNANTNAETNDFLKAIREATGKSMEWFFDEWIYRGGEPHYSISYKNISNETHIYVSQIHNTESPLIGVFKMPVVIEVHYSDGSYDSAKVWIDKKEQTVTVPNPQKKKISYVLFDPGRKIIKHLTFNKSFEELSEQALKAKHLLDRYDALVALRIYDFDKKFDLFKKCFGRENFHLNKSEIISQVSSSDSRDAREFLKKAIYDKDAQVRKTLLNSLTKIHKELEPDYKTLLNDPAYFNVELALTNLCSSFPEKANEYLEITKNKTGWRGKNIRIKWLELALKFGNKYDSLLNELIDYSSSRYEFETRINAITGLKNLNYLDAKYSGFLCEAYLDWHNKLNTVAQKSIEFYIQQNDKRKIIIDFISSSGFSGQKLKTIYKLINN